MMLSIRHSALIHPMLEEMIRITVVAKSDTKQNIASGTSFEKRSIFAFVGCVLMRYAARPSLEYMLAIEVFALSTINKTIRMLNPITSVSPSSSVFIAKNKRLRRKVRSGVAISIPTFVNILVGFDGDVDLESGRYKVDGKSILGIFSLDLSKPLVVEIYADDCEELLAKLKPFIVE
jgi:phosphotransferase system HPr-like phosphotransfer protein